MWVLDLAYKDSSGTFLMQCDFDLKTKVEELVSEIIKDLESKEHTCNVDVIVHQLDLKGYTNGSIHRVSIHV